jgi:Zn finger protein HypA/HybF involved in hydrogenase expression
MKQYKAKSGKTQYMPAFSSLEKHIKASSNKGYCLACGKLAHNVEPDARKYTCEKCGNPKVYGAEELLMMGLHHD